MCNVNIIFNMKTWKTKCWLHFLWFLYLWMYPLVCLFMNIYFFLLSVYPWQLRFCNVDWLSSYVYQMLWTYMCWFDLTCRLLPYLSMFERTMCLYNFFVNVHMSLSDASCVYEMLSLHRCQFSLVCGVHLFSPFVISFYFFHFTRPCPYAFVHFMSHVRLFLYTPFDYPFVQFVKHLGFFYSMIL
jgi:hypothetical protein